LKPGYFDMRLKGRILVAIFLIFFAEWVSASENIWLSNTPPKKISKEILHGMHGVSLIKGKDGREKKILWLRSGSFPVEARYVNCTNTRKPAIFVCSPDGKPIEGNVSPGQWGYVLTFEGNLEGFYNVYLFEKFVEGGTLNIVVAKAEVLSHKCSNGHAGIRKKMPPKIFKDEICFEIVRKRISGEDFHTFLSSGDEVAFKVFLNGAPLKLADIKFCTQKKWAKNLKTDINGEAFLQLIGDYYPRWNKLNKRKIHNFLVTAEYTEKKSGSCKGIPYERIHYTGTLGGSYIPSETMYTSYLYGLFLLIFVMIVTAAFIYFHRERRKKPYKEYVFSEKD